MLAGITGAIIGILGVVAATFTLLSEELKRNKKLKYAIVAVLFTLALYAMIGSWIAIGNSERSPLQPATSSVPIAVDATKDWQSSAITVNRGDRVSIRVVGGKWTASRRHLTNDERENLPENVKNSQIWVNCLLEDVGDGWEEMTCEDLELDGCPVPTGSIGALVAKIGTGEPFVIGSEGTFIASESGAIFLRMNDSSATLDDNAGVLAIEMIR